MLLLSYGVTRVADKIRQSARFSNTSCNHQTLKPCGPTGLIDIRLSIIIRREFEQSRPILRKNQFYNGVTAAHDYIIIFYNDAHAYRRLGPGLVPLVLEVPDVAFPN